MSISAWPGGAFGRDRGGNFHLLTVILAIPLLVSVGLAVDYSRYLNGQAHLQELADAGALAMASSRETLEAKLRQIADKQIAANLDGERAHGVTISDFRTNGEDFELSLSGRLPTTFMRIMQTDYVNLSGRSVAKRSVEGSVEVALVLDNTYSMSDTDSGGTRKIDALKSSATQLVRELFKNASGSTKVALVPYADYVNVGTANRSASWLSVPDDYSKTSERSCEWRNTKSRCLENEPKRTCTRTVDGIEETYSCGGGCIRSETYSVDPYEVCSGGGTTKYGWYGCVGSRRAGTTRLHDGTPTETYPGYLATRQMCPSPIVALTDSKWTLETAISNLVIELPGYRPLTYIPTGLIWGVNVLSPGKPFAEGRNYDPKNKMPRKVLVLMTDGENTLRFRRSDGRHIAFDGNATQIAKQEQQTHEDGLAVCDYAKKNGIEIFTIAFAVESTKGKELMSKCAADANHYFDASDSAELAAAFADIASSLTMVRLTE
ncbi:MAG: hypothetical protein K5872_11935 [Rhizobiaceae bacterium]|nr:hypothetical protein [Rhizobiaceae bacterium]MCV0406925.1 hypothetical protein [Rhizobiaceae bacterium]